MVIFSDNWSDHIRQIKRFFQIMNFSDIAAPLTNLLSKKVKFVWTDDCQLAFDKVKLLLQKSPVLKSPEYEKPLKLIIDSSDVGTGSV